MNYLPLYHGLGGDIKESSKKALERGAKKIQKNAKYLAPVDAGHLRNSIKTKSESTQDGAKAQVFVEAEYGAYVEFGTGQRGASSHVEKPEGANIHYNARWMGQVAQPYMTPAYLHAKNTGEVEQEVEKTIQQEIRKMERGK